MALSTNDILKVVVSLAFPESVVAQNIFWVLFDNDGPSADEDDVLDDMEEWIEDLYTQIISKISDEITMDDLKVYVYDSSEDDFDEVGDRALSVNFNQTADFLPLGVAVLQRANTVNPDVQGRKYWGGLCEVHNTAGRLEASAVADFILAGSAWIAPFVGTETGSTFTPGVYSLTKSAFYAFGEDLLTNLVLSYQRRRKPGVGI